MLSKSSKIKIALIIMPIITLIFVVANFIYIKQFNQQERTFVDADTTYSVSMSIGGREGSTSEWMKKDYNLYGRPVDLHAQTIDGTFKNNTHYEIRDWKLRINFDDECFFNNAWCGTVEIHQDVLTKEKVQTLDLRNYNLDDVELDYLYDGDLLIPLSKGDYIIYYPSVKDNEIPVEKMSEMTMGFIIYYRDFPDMSSREISYSFERDITDGYAIIILGILIIAWVLLIIVHAVYFLTLRVAGRDLEIKKSGIASMSDMYAIIYIIDIIKDELMPVVADEESEKLRPKDIPASEQLRNMFKYDCEDIYQDVAYEFCDLTTLDERLKSRATVVFEYKSRFYGWCRIRFFAMDKEKNLPLEKVVFTIQVINDEKEEMEAIAQRVDVAERESKAKSSFLANMSHEIRTPINTIIGFDTMILRESKEPSIKSYAKTINSSANMLLSIINGILDISKLEAGKMEIVPEEYSFKQMISDVVTMITCRTEFEKLQFICDVSPDIHDNLYGDSVRLKQVIINLLTNAVKYTDEGSVKLAIYGKQHEDKEHLLIYVKDTGIGIREEDQKKLTERFSRFDTERNHSVEGTGLGLNLVAKILSLMGSELHVVSTYGEGSEFYFEVEQKILSDEKIGVTDFRIETEEYEYKAMFSAPEAKILAVDDNEMNLSVFKNLLKETAVQIDTANSGKEALEKCAEKKYDLIFMDHMMPGMDGVECFKEIRSHTEWINHDTTVIVLTANALKGAKEEYEAIGFDDFLVKPIVGDQLERMVLKHLNPELIKANTEIKSAKEPVEEIPAFSGVDASYGIAHTGDLKNYITLLKQVNGIGATEIQELKSYLDKISSNNDDLESLHSFRIKIHSMKSTCNMMGALKLYGLAATIEELASKESANDVLLLTPFFIEGWENLSGEIREYFKEEITSNQAIDIDKINEYLNLLETSIKVYDIKNSDSVVAKLKDFDWNNDEVELIQKLEIAVANLNADEVVSICNSLKR